MQLNDRKLKNHPKKTNYDNMGKFKRTDYDNKNKYKRTYYGNKNKITSKQITIITIHTNEQTMTIRIKLQANRL